MIVGMAGDAGVDVIATDVQSEADAVSLIDMGVDLMIGDRLSAPRRLSRRRNQAILSRHHGPRKALLVNGA